MLRLSDEEEVKLEEREKEVRKKYEEVDNKRLNAL
jgi:hypothetical protein